ncbi:MAG: 2-isopropylmalate synthase [Francisellaceae bacterium]|jgi:2-isopropylmalate synthase|nr:2-isopropylmalate synthase [Francisellaceae bacterium]MBT6206636.1 2-isopropylmalate synthase [Francisellaceae bacterium]MBT6539463.1 2-isopropylmalate synthase [Francisellaceae bacterium]
MKAKDDLLIFDTTLRDGEQCPGASMDAKEKLEIAKALEDLKVDIIEAGFPISSSGDFKAVNLIAKNIKNSIICGLARTTEKDIDAVVESLKPAQNARVHTFIATSQIHMQYKLKMSEDDVIEKAKHCVKYARNFVGDVEFSAEDAGRSEPEFLCKIIEAVIDVGATTINIPDTVGYTFPTEYGALIAYLIKNIPNSDKAVFSTHCHNDLGLAVANSLSGVLNGARQVECTINGIGERAGNAALEEVVMNIRTRSDLFPVSTNIKTENILKTSQLVSETTGFAVQRNKAIVGVNSFAHEAGIHQDGILKERTTYEIMLPSQVGWDSNSMVLGKHSGRRAFVDYLENKLEMNLSDEQINEAFSLFKDKADEYKIVSDEQIDLIVKKVNAKHE